jgi:predicted enzyme related to lactoylglutathione lyase
MSREAVARVREAIATGADGGHLLFACDHACNSHAHLESKGVEVTEEALDQPHGIDFGLRDPFGNHLRMAQMEQP